MAQTTTYITLADLTFNQNADELTAILQYKRLKTAGAKVKLVTKNFNNSLTAILKHYDLTDADVLNMYRYYTDTDLVPDQHQNLENSPFVDRSRYQINGAKDGLQYMLEHGRAVAKITPIPFDKDMTINEIQWKLRTNSMAVSDIYDYRGYKASTAYFNLPSHSPGRQLNHLTHYDRNAVPRIEVFIMNAHDDHGTRLDDQFLPTSYVIRTMDGKTLHFDNEFQMFRQFMSDLVRNGDEIYNHTIELNSAINHTMDDHLPSEKILRHLVVNTVVQTAPQDLTQAPYGAALLDDTANFDDFIVSSKSQFDFYKAAFSADRHVVYEPDLADVSVKLETTHNDSFYTLIDQVLDLPRVEALSKLVIDVKKDYPDLKCFILSPIVTPEAKDFIDTFNKENGRALGFDAQEPIFLTMSPFADVNGVSAETFVLTHASALVTFDPLNAFTPWLQVANAHQLPILIMDQSQVLLERSDLLQGNKLQLDLSSAN
ncbi:hypothetical protein [Pseudolactococcus insecticola]|uniref:Uncharacterized protein n=1 Tax=Pseudolactococcus insecticola TaxID=2709158 RepID=A0A6A0B8V1_9LACT|nr:hypothetical protein [Lactococcus insecticola]GFH40734.1 hypothetical protein Hs20B_11320 [Lactococcus insecticola]